MAVLFDNRSEVDGGNVSSLTWSHTIGSNSDRVLYVIGANNSGDPVDWANVSATYNGDAMTAMYNSSPNRSIGVFRLLAPDVGTANIVVSWTGGNKELRFVGASFYNVDQTDPDDAVGETDAGGTSSSESVSSATDDMVIDVLISAGGITALTAGSGQTEVNQMTGGFKDSIGVSYEAGASSVTMSWTWSGFASFGHWRWNINAATGGGGGFQAAWARNRNVILGVRTP